MSSRRPVNAFRSSTFIGVTSALSCIDDVTYAVGVGGDVIIAHFDDQHICRVKAKAHLSAIHRVRTLHTRRLTDDDETIVFAAAHRTLVVYRLSRLRVLQRISIVNADQRIITVQSVVNDASTMDVLVGTAHNSVECWKLTQRPLPSLTRGYSVRGERCILYTMSVHQTTVFAGTVYGDIIMWSAQESEVLPEVRDVQQRLSGHRGVVFSIDVAHDMSLIASASDDRTVILWKRRDDGRYVQQATFYGHASRVWQCRIIDQHNDVVSCGEDGTVRCWNVQSGECTGILTCRAGIRNIAIQYNSNSAILAVDDGSIQLWDSQQSSAQMTSISVTTSHGKDYDDLPNKPKRQLFTESCRHLKLCDNETIIVASSLHNLQRLVPLNLSDKCYQSHRILLPEHDVNVSDVVVTALSMSPSADLIAVGCKNGAVYITSLLNNTEYAYITAHRAAVTFILWMTMSDTSAQLLSADALGHVKHWRVDMSPSSMTLVLLTSFRLANQSPVTAALAIQSADKHILLMGDMRGSLYVYTVHSLSDDHVAIVAQTRLIDVHETCALTCFLLTAQSHAEDITFISAGRNNTINFYTLKEQTADHMLSQDSSSPLNNGGDAQNDNDTWRSHHNGLIPAEDMTCVYKQSSYAYTIVEDRAYRIRGLTSAERIWTVNEIGTIVACGFRADMFVLIDVTNETVIATVDCGGGRRPWDYDHCKQAFLFSRRTKSDDNELVYSQLPIHTSSSVTTNKGTVMMSMTKSFHSRLCTSLVVINHHSYTFVITGSEDMTIKLYRLNTTTVTTDNNNNCIHESLSLINTLTDHPDAIRCLSLVKHDSSTFTLYSAGSCHYLHAYQLNIIDNNNNNQNSENNENVRLSIRSYGGIGGKVWKLTGKVWLRQAETEAMRMTKMDIRITALTAFNVDTQIDCVVTGDSTGQMIIYIFAYSTCRFYPVHHVTSAHNRVVMALTDIYETSTNEHFIISGGSDGVMSIWNVTTILRTAIEAFVRGRLAAVEVSAPEKRVKQRTSGRDDHQNVSSDDAEQQDLPTDNVLSPIISIAAHQCGCNAIAAYVTADGRIIIATGGDDQMLRVTAVSVSNHLQTNYTTNVVVNAHTSSITSVVIIDHQTLLSSGYDQRLRRWHVKDDLDVQLIPIDHFELNVSDVTSIAVSTANTIKNTTNERSAELRRVFVGGDGMQILVINDASERDS